MNMHDKLKQLRRAMSRTVFKDFDVNKQELKRNVLNQSKKHHPFLNLKQWMRTGLSAVSVVILCFIIVITGFSEQLFDSPQQGQADKNAQQTPTEVEGDEDYYWEDQLKPSEEYPEKFQIVNKMHNSRDNIHTTQGSFEYYSSPGDNNKIEFYVDFDRNLNRTVHKDYKDGKLKETLHYLFKDGVVLRKKEEDQIFNHLTLSESHNENKEYFIYSNTTAYTGHIFTSEWDSLIYNNYENWSFTEGEKFGMPVYEIEGVVTEDMSESLAGPFTMTISKETGALLDLKAYGQSKEPFLSLSIDNIQINQGVPEDVFQLDVSGYKEMPNFDFNISGIENYQPKTGGVDTSKD